MRGTEHETRRQGGLQTQIPEAFRSQSWNWGILAEHNEAAAIRCAVLGFGVSLLVPGFLL